MKNIVLLFILTATTSLNAYSFKPPVIKPTENKVLKQIIKNKPDIDPKLAKRLSLYINKYASKYNADPHRAVAVAMQESGYRQITSFKTNNNYDVGMFQINVRTIKEYGFSSKKLINDLEYSVEAYFKVIRNKKEICKYLKEEAWSCYHSRTKHHRIKYKQMVNRFYIKKGMNEKIVKN